MCEAAASCKDIARAPVTNWEPQCVTLAGYSYVVRQGKKIQLVTPHRTSLCNVTALRYAVTLQVCTHLRCVGSINAPLSFATPRRIYTLKKNISDQPVEQHLNASICFLVLRAPVSTMLRFVFFNYYL